MPREVLVGIDLGTSAVKILACTTDGSAVAQASARYQLVLPRPGWVEQDANLVYRTAMGALRGVLAEVSERGGRIQAIGFSSAMHGLLLVDARGEPQGPLLPWLDGRSAAVAERWHADGTAARLYAATGAPVHPMLPSCKLRWFATEEPRALAAASKAVSLKELFVHRWTGEWFVDWGVASGTGLFDPRTRAWSPYALETAGIAPERLSHLASPTTVLRGLRPAVASELGVAEHTAIVLASSDGALANLGAGAVGPRDVGLTLGTSGAIRIVVDRPAFDARGRRFCYAFDDRKYVTGGSTSSAGAVLDALQALVLDATPVAERFELATRLAQSSPRGANALTVLPFLSGERAPYWESNLRGGIIGLDLSHTRADVLRASFEGCVFALATVFEIVREGTDTPERIALTGGIVSSAFVRQLVADVFGVTATRSQHVEASAFGAAMMAGIATGEIADDAAVADRLCDVDVHEPDPVAHAAYASAFARFREVVAANLPLFAERS